MNFSSLDYINTINYSAHAFFQSIQNPQLTKVMILITNIGGPSSVSLLCLAVLMFMWLHKKTAHMIQFSVTIVSAAIITYLVKVIVKLPRPEGGLISESGYSFASGHAMMATVFFGLVLYSYKSHFKNRIARRIFIASNVLAVLLVGLSRVYLGVHYATDVIAGFVIGTVIVAISVLIHQNNMKRPGRGLSKK